MDETYIHKRRLFFSWQDEKQEAWLGEMSRQGLHLKRTRSLWQLPVREGICAGVFLPPGLQPGQAAGGLPPTHPGRRLEHLGRRGGWHYWRKGIQGDQMPELFTDPESRSRSTSGCLPAILPRRLEFRLCM